MPHPRLPLDYATAERVDEFERWLAEPIVGRNLSPRSARRYASYVRSGLSRLGDLVAALREAIKHMWPSTVLPYAAAYARWAAFTGNVDLAVRLKTVPLPPPAGRKKIRYPMTADDFASLQEAIEGVADPVVRDVLAIQIKTGRRLVDLVRIERSAIAEAAEPGPNRGVLVNRGKGRVLDRIPVSKSNGGDFIWSHLYRLFHAGNGDWHRVADLLVDSRAGVAAEEEAAGGKLRKALYQAAESVGLPPGAIVEGGVYPHRLRRTKAVAVLRKAGGDRVAVKKAMGWRSDRTVDQYLDHPEDAKVSDLLTD